MARLVLGSSLSSSEGSLHTQLQLGIGRVVLMHIFLQGWGVPKVFEAWTKSGLLLKPLGARWSHFSRLHPPTAQKSQFIRTAGALGKGTVVFFLR